MPRSTTTASSGPNKEQVDSKKAFATRILFYLGVASKPPGQRHVYMFRTNDGGLHLYPTKPDGMLLIDLESVKDA